LPTNADVEIDEARGTAALQVLVVHLPSAERTM
jgi:hypothetical protein